MFFQFNLYDLISSLLFWQAEAESLYLSHLFYFCSSYTKHVSILISCVFRVIFLSLMLFFTNISGSDGRDAHCFEHHSLWRLPASQNSVNATKTHVKHTKNQLSTSKSTQTHCKCFIESIINQMQLTHHIIISVCI